MTNVTVGTQGYIDLTYGPSSQYNVATQSTPGSIKIEFPGTNTVPSVTNYAQYRQFKMFNRLVNIIDSPNKDKIAMNLGPNISTDGYKKYSLSTATITNIVSSSTQNKSFILNTALSNADLADVVNGYLVFYTTDNEFILGTEEVVTKNEIGIAVNVSTDIRKLAKKIKRTKKTKTVPDCSLDCMPLMLA